MTPRVFEDMAGLRLPDRPAHVAIGMFDGVHRGHQIVIDAAVREARRTSGLAGVFTFWPHPSRLFHPDHPTPMIFGPQERNHLLLRLGVDFVVVQPFTREFAAIAAEDFVCYLKSRMPHLRGIYVGENWRFGRGRRGDVDLLVRLGRAAQVSVVSAPRLSLNGEPISSTRIRALLERGDMTGASELLGYPYFCSGEVVPGRQLGNRIGFPTLNIAWTPELQPALGIYVVLVRAAHDERAYRGVASYGVRPTVESDGAPLLEVHLLDDCPFRTGDRLRVEWLQYLRPEARFASLDELREAIARDRDSAAAYFAARATASPPAQ